MRQAPFERGGWSGSVRNFDASRAELSITFNVLDVLHDLHDFVTTMATESSQVMSPNPPLGRAPSSRSRSSSKLDDVPSLTSFNPFSEEDEHDQSSYALVSSLFSKVKNTFAAPLVSATAAATAPAPEKANTIQSTSTVEPRRPSIQFSNSNTSNKSNPDRPNPLHVIQSNPAPPLVSLTPVTCETPTYVDMERTPSQGGSFYPPEVPEGGGYGTYIPGFPIQDSDARSIRTTASVGVKRSASVSKVIRRIRGEGMFLLFLLR